MRIGMGTLLFVLVILCALFLQVGVMAPFGAKSLVHLP